MLEHAWKGIDSKNISTLKILLSVFRFIGGVPFRLKPKITDA